TVEGPNSPIGNGGGIYQFGGTLYVFNSSFLGNDVKAFGGGTGGALRLTGGITVIANSTFSNNTTDSFGGAIAGTHVELSVSSSVFDNNSAHRSGGAIEVLQDTSHVSISGTTFTNNQVLTPTTGSGGGAIADSNAALAIANSTFANNRSGS